EFGNWDTMTSPSGNPSMASLDVVVSNHNAKSGRVADIACYSASKRDNTYGPSFLEDGTRTSSRFYNPKALWDKYMGNSSIPADFKNLVVDQVLDDYKSLRNNPRLGSEDRQRLDSHIDLLATTQQKVNDISCNNLVPPSDTITD